MKCFCKLLTVHKKRENKNNLFRLRSVKWWQVKKEITKVNWHVDVIKYFLVDIIHNKKNRWFRAVDGLCSLIFTGFLFSKLEKQLFVSKDWKNHK